ncbi:MAG: helix-turn-helix transcriptional regulator [Clostridia bacterium]|nr:helix-turn-helix transcriptional regulator [Clostridia bacterium]
MHMETRLKELRKSKGITQIALQISTGIDQALLSKYENGQRVPTLEAMIALSDYYQVSIDYILKRSDQP